MKLTLAGLLCLLTTQVGAAPLNVELVINGDAETGDMTGWLENGIESVLTTGPATGFGLYAFTGGAGPALQTASQRIDVSGNAAAIDVGTLNSVFSIYLQGREDSGFVDPAIVTVTFRDALDINLTSYTFQDTNNLPLLDWDLFTDTRVIPVGTRNIDIMLNTNRSIGTSSDGFFDEVSLKVTAVPLPASFWLFGAGIIALRRGRL